MSRFLIISAWLIGVTNSLVPFLDGGKEMPKLYDGWFNEQIAKQASTSVSKAIAAGKVGLGFFLGDRFLIVANW